MPEELPYVIEYAPAKNLLTVGSLIPKRKVALLLTGSSPEINGHRIQRVPLNASIIQTIDTLIQHNYDSVHVLGHGNLIHSDPFYGYSTFLTRETLERRVRYLRETLTPDDLLLVVIRGLHIDTRGTFLSLYDKTDILGFELRDLLHKISTRQIMYCSIGTLVSALVEREQENGLTPLCIAPTKPIPSFSHASFSLTSPASSRFYRHFFCSDFFPSLYDRFRSAALRTAQEETQHGHFCAYLRHSPELHAEKSTL